MQNEEQEPLAAADAPPTEAIRTHLGDLTNEIAHKYSLLEGNHQIIAQAIQKLDLRGGFTTTWQAKSLEQALNLSQVTDLVKEVIKQQKSSYSSRSVTQSRTICALLAHICESVWMRC